MKKIWLIMLAALLAFGLVIGCGGDDSPGGGGQQGGNDDLVETTVFDLATDEIIQAFSLGALPHGSGAGAPGPFGDALIIEAGGASHISYEAVKGPGDQAVSIKMTSNETWGPGIDLPHSAFNFRQGDVITIKGEVLTMPTGAKLQLNRNIGSEHSIGAEINETGAFEIKHTLGATDMGDVTTGAQTGLRLECRAVIGVVVRVDNITVVGMRAADGLATPEASHFNFLIRNQEAGDVDGIVITPRSGFSTGAITVYYTGVEGTTYAKSATVPQAVGKYEVTFDVAAAEGFRAVEGLVAGILEVVEELGDGPVPGAIDVGISSPIRFGSIDDNPPENLDWDLFVSSKFIIFEFEGSNGNRDGFGGFQVATQYEGDGYGWNQYSSPDWTGFANEVDETTFWVFPMNKLLKYDEIVAFDEWEDEPGAKIILNHGFGNLVTVWLTDKNITLGTPMHGEGWLTKTLDGSY